MPPTPPVSLTIYQLDRHTCHYPFGDRPPYSYCGEPARRGSWCPQHERVVYPRGNCEPRTITAADYLRSGIGEHRLQALVLAASRGLRPAERLRLRHPERRPALAELAARMKAEGLRAGIADLCIMLPGGRTGWLELKNLKGGRATRRPGFAAICERLGHAYAVVRTLDEAIVVLKDMGRLK